MDEQEAAAPQSDQAPKKDRWVKLIFLAVALAGIVVIWMRQRQGQTLDWGENLTTALELAREKKKKVLVFFTSDPPGEEARWNIKGTLAKKSNLEAIEEHKCIPVKIALDTALESTTAKRYRIQALPTMLLLDSDGKELNRRVGKIGETEFRNGFLDLAKIEKPD